jgi:colanic acid/amylovoran biosynthesis glycosyltransferase
VRIAVLVNEFPTASETFVLDQICALLERGHEVDVFPDRHRAHAPVLHSEFVRHQLLDRSHFPPTMPGARIARVAAGIRLLISSGAVHAPPLFRALNPLAYGRQATSLALLFRCVPLLGSMPYDIVHCHHGPVALVGTRLRQLGVLRGRLVATFHGFDANAVPRTHGARFYDPLFRAADLITVNSEFLRGRLRDMGAPEQRLIRLPMGVDVASFAPVSGARRPGARGRAGDEIRLLSVARLVEEKGISIAVRAVARLTTRYPGLRYQVVGEGPLRPSLERLAANLGVADRVTWLGALPRDRVREYYTRAHLFALPGIIARSGAQESQGVALLEAQASGLPVVASAVGGIPESLLDGKSGFLVPERDADALAETVATLIDRPELRARMGSAGQAFVRENFDRNTLANRLVALYEGVVASRPAPVRPLETPRSARARPAARRPARA